MPRRTAPIPIWSNILLRTAIYYAILGVALVWLKSLSVGGLPIVDDSAAQVIGLGKKALAKELAPQTGPAALPTASAMISALLFALPVS